MMKRPLWNTIVQILGKIGGVGISLITTGILTRKLGVTGYGNFVLIGSLFVLLDALADFGTSTIGVREVSKEEDKNVVEHVFNLRLMMAAASFGIGLIMVWLWKGLAGIRVEATVAMLMVFLTSIAGFWGIIFQSKLRMDLKVIMDICFSVAFLIWLLIWPGKLSLLLIFAVYLLARIVSLAVGFNLVKEVWKGKVAKIDMVRMRELWKATWPMGVFLLMYATYDRAIDSLLIQNFFGATQVAWYGLAYKMYGALLQPAYFYVNSIFPMMSSKMPNKRQLFWESAGLMLAGSIALIIGVYMTAPWMVSVLAGNAFGPSVTVLRVLIIAALFSYMGHLVGFTLISQGGQKQMLKVGAAGLVSNLVLNLIFIPRYGMMAGAWVTVLTEGVDTAMMTWFLWALVKKK
jgi:O-antigen/teichoic acid export membrane protein